MHKTNLFKKLILTAFISTLFSTKSYSAVIEITPEFQLSAMLLQKVSYFKINSDQETNSINGYQYYYHPNFDLLNVKPDNKVQCNFRASILASNEQAQSTTEITWPIHSPLKLQRAFMYSNDSITFTLSAEFKSDSDSQDSLFIDCVSLNSQKLNLDEVFKFGLVSK